MFLVSAQDRVAHDIFRRFRASFEARAARYEHLVIFGQHGISSTVRTLLKEFGLVAGAGHVVSLPVLLLFAGPLATIIYTLPLPTGGPGSNPPSDGPGLDILARIESAVDRGEDALELVSLPTLTAHQLEGTPLVGLVGRALEGLEHS
jgi:hypothetical protein